MQTLGFYFNETTSKEINIVILCVPLTIVDVECIFSKMVTILVDFRQGMTL